MEQPLVSVCIVTYNQELYIEKTIASVLQQQTSFKWEILIADDHSSDGTSLICEKYRDEYPDLITYYRNPENIGLLNNYTQTLNRCKGKYIALCPGDDYWIDPLKLSKQVDFLEANPGHSLVCSNWKDLIQETGKLIDRAFDKRENWLSESTSGKECVNDFLLGRMEGTRDASFCLRNDVYQEAFSRDPFIFTNKDFPCQDVQLLTEMIYRGKIGFQDEDMVVYRLSEGSASITSDERKQILFLLKVFKLKLYIWKKYDLPGETLDYLCRRNLSSPLKYAFLERDEALGNAIKEALAPYPYALRLSHKLMFLGIRNTMVYYLFKGVLKGYENTIGRKR